MTSDPFHNSTPAPSPSSAYETPRLVEYGHVQDLTHEPSIPGGIPGGGGTGGGGFTVF